MLHLLSVLLTAEALLRKESTSARTLHAKALALDIECEEMCKKMGSYPNGCQCPGWNGNAASSDEVDGRNCYAKYCVPIAHTADPCPSDDFVTCVAEHSKVPSLLQVDWQARVEATEAVVQKMQQRLMAKALALGVECEEMCKATGAYPNGCQCPGWNGNPASSSEADGRDCYTKYCVPIAHTADPCPSDDFVTCVAEHSK